MSAIVDDAAVKTGPPVAAEIANRVLGRITRDRNGSDRQVIPALLSSSLAAAAIIRSGPCSQFQSTKQRWGRLSGAWTKRRIPSNSSCSAARLAATQGPTAH